MNHHLVVNRGVTLSVGLMPTRALSRLRTVMADDPTREYFAGRDRDRAAFEAGIKVGSIAHQDVGTPLTSPIAPSLQRAIQAATNVLPLGQRIPVRIDRNAVP